MKEKGTTMNKAEIMWLAVNKIIETYDQLVENLYEGNVEDNRFLQGKIESYKDIIFNKESTSE